MTYERILDLAHSKALANWSRAKDLHDLCPNEMAAIDEKKAWDELVEISTIIYHETERQRAEPMQRYFAKLEGEPV